MAVFVLCLLWIVFRKRASAAGIAIGVFSGTLSGFVPLFQKISASEMGRSLSLFPENAGLSTDWLGGLLSVFANPFAVAWIVLSLASMLVLQFAYKKADVIRIIPFFSSATIVIPVIGGVLCLGERLHPAQWAGAGFVLIGLFLLTFKGRGNSARAKDDSGGAKASEK
jgi:drug/metabolite transporter (DMT)-like permease